MGSDRYSFKIEFDHYIEQTFKGLDKLVLNNCYADATMMKEYLTYDMFSYLGTDSSLFSFAKVSVNGEYFGLYLALEAVEESFMQRNYGSDYGDLYKPDSMGFGGRGGMMGADMNEITDMFKQKSGEETSDVQTISVSAVNGSSDMGNMPQNFDMSNMPQDFDMGNMPQDFDMGNMPQDFDMGNRPQDFDMGNRPQDFGMGEMPDTGKTQEDTQSQIRPDMGGRSFSKGDAGALNYIDDELSSYDEIWDASVFSSSDSDKRRVVTALENISNGSNIEEYMDVDNMLKYLAVQTYVVNLDGLAGSMAHNYYLSEIDGRLNLIPWDYNLAFGGFMSGDASQTVNFPIDTPFTSGLNQREFFAALLENEEYLSIYHGYLNELAQRYSGDSLERIVSAVEEEINYLVETDPTAFYTYEEYEERLKPYFKKEQKAFWDSFQAQSQAQQASKIKTQICLFQQMASIFQKQAA